MDGGGLVNDRREQLEAEIRDGEKWLAERLGEAVHPNLELLKRHVSVAVEEQWLARTLVDDQKPELIRAIKNKLREVGRGASSSDVPSSIRLRWSWFVKRSAAVAALAACVVFAWRWNESTSVSIPSDVLTEAFIEFDAGELSSQLALLESDIEMFGAWEPDEYTETDAIYDDASESIDRLLGDEDWPDDWSS